MSPVVYFNMKASNYDQNSSAEVSTALMARFIEIAMGRKGSFNGKILDVGIATGFQWQNFPGFDVKGIDGSEKMLAKARNIGIPASSLFQIDLEDVRAEWPVPDNTFGLTVSMATLGYISSASMTIKKMIEKTQPGGLIVFDAITTKSDKLIACPQVQDDKYEVPLYAQPLKSIYNVTSGKTIQVGQKPYPTLKFTAPAGVSQELFFLQKNPG